MRHAGVLVDEANRHRPAASVRVPLSNFSVLTALLMLADVEPGPESR
jgi:hypothetical protein